MITWANSPSLDGKSTSREVTTCPRSDRGLLSEEHSLKSRYLTFDLKKGCRFFRSGDRKLCSVKYQIVNIEALVEFVTVRTTQLSVPVPGVQPPRDNM